MPAAAVIPAPIAYIKVVAVKKLVVELLAVPGARLRSARGRPSVCEPFSAFTVLGWGSRHFTLRKLECFRQAIAWIL